MYKLLAGPYPFPFTHVFFSHTLISSPIHFSNPKEQWVGNKASHLTTPELKGIYSLDYYLTVYNFVPLQVHLGDIVSSVQDHHNKANITIKEITQFFGFPVHIKQCSHYTAVYKCAMVCLKPHVYTLLKMFHS